MPSPTDRIVASDNHTTYRTTVAPNAKVAIAVPPGRAFTALKAVYDELGIPAGINEPANGRIGNTNFFKTRKLANEAISTYLDCGNSITGPAADNYRVYISLVSVVRPDGKGGFKGRAFVPKHNIRAGATIRWAGSDTMLVKGCVIGIICKEQRWTRVSR